MLFSPQATPDVATLRKHSTFYLIWGIVLLILGIIAISAATVTTLISVIFLGFLLFICGVVIIIDSFTSWWHRWNGFWLHLIMGILYLILGVMLIKSPLLGSISITFLLGIFYIIIGAFRIFYSSSMRALRWGWVLFNGIITLLLGILILMSWPGSSLFIIGLFVGIDLLFAGWAYIMAALGARSLSKT